MTLRILNLEGSNLSPAARARLQLLGTLDDHQPPAPLPSDLSAYAVFTTRFDYRLDAGVLARAPNLRFIVSPTTGLDHIDVGAAEAQGVRIICLRGEYEFLRDVWASAEHSWALLLALVRQMPSALQAPGKDIWAQRPFFGTELARKRLGIVGLGRIGEKIARYGNAFDMRVMAYDPAPKGRAENVRMMPDLDSLLAETDILSIHVPLQADTRGLIGARELARLPRGALVLNTARGAILDEVALLSALKDGQIAGAALDVLEGEGTAGFPGQHPLVAYAQSHQNLLITPHIGGSTWESRQMTELFVITALEKSLAGSGA